jgi:PST family polysaccharide transporter
MLPSQIVVARPLVARLVGNVSWLVLERLIVLATGFALNIWYVRYLGPAQYGLISYAASYCSVFATAATLGMDTIIVRELARNPGSTGEILGTALALRTAVGAVAWAAAVAVARGVGTSPDALPLIAILGTGAVFTGAGLADLWFQAVLSARAPALLRAGVVVVSYGVRAALILAHASLTAFAILTAATAGASALALWILLGRQRAGLRLAVRVAWTRVLLRNSWPMLVVAFSITVYMKIDQVMLASMIGRVENGIYAAAVTISELWYFLPMAIASSVLPVITAMRDRSSAAQLERKMQNVYDAMAALAYAIIVPVTLASEPLVQALYGETYARSADVLRVHIWALLFVALGAARAQYLVASEYLIFNLVATGFGAASNVALNLLLIPRLGALGAAWATVASYAISGHLSSYFHAGTRRHAALISRAVALPLRVRDALRGMA